MELTGFGEFLKETLGVDLGLNAMPMSRSPPRMPVLLWEP